jgi:pimeloyl-ACP methyl ester carboxylesterase
VARDDIPVADFSAMAASARIGVRDAWPADDGGPQTAGVQASRRRMLKQAGAMVAACAVTPVAWASETGETKNTRPRRVTSAASDGLRLAVFQAGNPAGPPIVFVHGFSQSHESWDKQFHDPMLLQKFHLIAYDLRGHGQSDKPLVPEAYRDSRKWADDLRSVVQATCRAKPCVVAWSYGGRVINDYLGVYGDDDLRALNYVAATSTGDRSTLGRSYPLLLDMLSDDPAIAQRGTEAFLRACFERQPSAAAMAEMVRFNNETPVAVRKLLGGRPADYDATLRRIKVPVLVTHGDQDQISAVAMSRYTVAHVAQARLSLYQGVGHSTFYEDTARFNAELDSLISA